MDNPGEIAGHIGTPLTSNATKVLLLGSGELGKQLAMSFQNLGLEVHAVDKYQGAPAHQVAHYFLGSVCLLMPPAGEEGDLHVDEAAGGLLQQGRDDRV